jgi:hypothetical protein
MAPPRLSLFSRILICVATAIAIVGLMLAVWDYMTFSWLHHAASNI